MRDEGVAAAWPGTPLIRISDYSSGVNFSPKVHGYSIGQFKADFLLLSQSSLRGMEITDTLDISSKAFPIGLDCCQARFLAPFMARRTQFGPFSDFERAQFEDALFSGAQFSGVVAFTIAEFKGRADFSRAVFRGPTTFTACIFLGPTDFTEAHFCNDADFGGAVFESSPNYSLAIFEGRTAFGDATFHQSATFDGSSFPGLVFLGGLPDDIKARIAKAHHPVRE
jgi:uncharacterized protein YjbI with pentapeptide repeats